LMTVHTAVFFSAFQKIASPARRAKLSSPAKPHAILFVSTWF